MAADPLTVSTVNDLFDDNFSDFEADPFADNPTTRDTRDDKAVLSPRAGLKRKLEDDKENDGLGLDEEVKIAKKRKPVAKLDEARLLSEPGIPKLRALSRSGQLLKKLRIKGKGHEFTDAARLLNHFQLWLDNLYPRAKFADALQLAEKAGHTKRMHIMRTEWINEGKPGYKRYDDVQMEDGLSKEPDLFGTAQTQDQICIPSWGESEVPAQSSTPILGSRLDDDAMFFPDANKSSRADRNDDPDDEELDALLAAQDDLPSTRLLPRLPTRADESEGEDDLDALLAEQDAMRGGLARSTTRFSSSKTIPANANADDEDLDALRAEQEVVNSECVTSMARKTNDQPLSQLTDDEDEDEDDLEALLAMQRTRTKLSSKDSEPSLPTPQHTSSPAKSASSPGKPSEEPIVSTAIFSSSPIPNNPEEVDLDDLDALLASQEAKTNARVQIEEQRTPKAKKVMDAMDELFSSPVPNRESQ